MKLKGLGVVWESPVTVTVLLWPARIDVGLKVQVAPIEQARVMLLLEKELDADAVTVKVAVVVPMTTVVDLGLAESAKTGFPVPVRGTACPPVLAVMLTEPIRLPVVVGVKTTVIVQLAPTLRTLGMDPQVLVCEKSPLTLIGAVRVTAARLVFERRTTCGGLATPTACGGKVTLLGDSVRDPADEATPVPVTTTRCGLPAASSLIVISSVVLPSVVGVKVT